MNEQPGRPAEQVPPSTPVDQLVAAAARGDQDAWADLVRRYSPLVVSVINRFGGLSRADAADVNQTVWLRLVENLDRIREPAALPMWIAKTTRHECLRLVRTGWRTRPFDPLDADATSADDAAEAPDSELLRLERQQALREGFAQLPRRCQELLALLLRDPPANYQEISEQMRIPVGSVGPTRGRCLHKLRTCPAVAAVVEALAVPERGNNDRRDVATVG